MGADVIKLGNQEIKIKDFVTWFEIKINHVDLGNGKFRWVLSSPPKELCDQLFERSWMPNVGTLHGKVVELPNGKWGILLVEEKV